MRHIVAGAYDFRMGWARILLGCLLVAMGAGKLSDLHGYATALEAFRLIPAAARTAVATAWTVAELGGGLLLLVGGRAARPGALLAVATSVGYAVLTTQAYVRQLPVANCTCFGVHLAQRLSWFVLVQDLYMLGLSGRVAWTAWRRAGDGRRSRPRSPAGSPARS